MPHLTWHDYWVVVSFIACLVGLFLLLSTNQTPADELQKTERSLLMMSFSYWMVYCIAFGIQKINLLDWDALLLGLKLTVAFSYFLTFSCILSLLLYRLALRQDSQSQSPGKRYG